jgi:hypothetical protein
LGSVGAGLGKCGGRSWEVCKIQDLTPYVCYGLRVLLIKQTLKKNMLENKILLEI